MNANEVIANRAIEILGGADRQQEAGPPQRPRQRRPVVATTSSRPPSTSPPIARSSRTSSRRWSAWPRRWSAKADEFDDVVKIGRTHLQDAVPIRLGQEFSRLRPAGAQRPRPAGRGQAAPGRAGARRHRRGHRAQRAARSSPTAVIARLAAAHRPPVRAGAQPLRGAWPRKDAAVEASGALKTIAVSLTKIANDIRWLASGPRCGIGEISIPSLQPGSSIMPGKVNPVIPEIGADGRRAGDRQRRHDHARRHVGHLRAQRDDAGDRLQPAAVDRDPGQRRRACSPSAASTGIEANRERCRGAGRAARWPCAPRWCRRSATTRRPRSPRRRCRTGRTVRELAREKQRAAARPSSTRRSTPGADRGRHPGRRRRRVGRKCRSPLRWPRTAASCTATWTASTPRSTCGTIRRCAAGRWSSAAGRRAAAWWRRRATRSAASASTRRCRRRAPSGSAPTPLHPSRLPPLPPRVGADLRHLPRAHAAGAGGVDRRGLSRRHRPPGRGRQRHRGGARDPPAGARGARAHGERRRRAQPPGRQDRLRLPEAGRPDRGAAGARCRLPAPLPVRRLHGVGPATERALAELGVHDGRRAAGARRWTPSPPASASTATRSTSSRAASTTGRSRLERERKSLATENTYAVDLTGLPAIEAEVERWPRRSPTASAAAASPPAR